MIKKNLINNNNNKIKMNKKIQNDYIIETIIMPSKSLCKNIYHNILYIR